VGKAVKKVASVAVGAFLTYKTMGAFSTAAKVGSTAFWKGTAPSVLGKVGSAFAGITKAISPGALQMGGLALQGVGYLQQRKSISAQADATLQATKEQKRINEANLRFQQVQDRRRRLDILRQQRVMTGQMEATTGASGLGLSGTSGFTGATSSIQSQTTANLGSLQASIGATEAISGMSQRAANYQSQANLASVQQQQWQQVGSLGSKIYEKGPEIFDLSKSIFG